MNKVVCISDYNIKEDMFGVGSVEIEANVPTEIPQVAYAVWKDRGYAIELAEEQIRDEATGDIVIPENDVLEGMEYNDLKSLAKKAGIAVGRSIKQVELLDLLKAKRGE